MPPYDPEDAGAACSKCVLRRWRAGDPVPSYIPSRTALAVLGEAPGAEEVRDGAPFVGASGLELRAALSAQGIQWSETARLNVLACRPPENKLEKVLLRLRRENKKRIARGEEAYATPMECCRARLQADLDASGTDQVIALGKTALEALTGSAHSILDMRGGPITAERMRILPTVHPAFVLRMQRWRRAFRSDIGRAVRFFAGRLSWEEPQREVLSTCQDVQRFLTWARRQPVVAYDYETTIGDPLTVRVRCLGLGTERRVGVIPVESCEDVEEGEQPRQLCLDLNAVKAELRDFFQDSAVVKIGWNSGYFDRMVTEQWLGVRPSPHIDGILLHRVVEPELPHSLSYAGALYTDVTSWKADHTGTNAQNDAELWHYNQTDVAVTAQVVPQLYTIAEGREQLHVAKLDHRLQHACVELHRIGMYVDERVRRSKERGLQKRVDLLRRQLGDVVGYELNFNSSSQVANLLFERWRLPVQHLTESGDPSTDDDTLRALMAALPRGGQQWTACNAMRLGRRASKYLGTFVRPLAQEHLDGEGRVHGTWNAHVAVTGRFSSSSPNLQNYPKVLRGLITAAPGHTLVAADMAQLELRLASAVAGAERYLTVFAAGGDPHDVTGQAVFGAKYTTAPKDVRKRLRDFAKRFVYAVIYGAADETVHEVITSAETPHGELIFGDVTVDETAVRREAWLADNPEFGRWWSAVVEEYRDLRFLRDPVWGRQRDFEDGENVSEVINYKIQAGGAAIVHEAMLELVEDGGPLTWGFGGPGTGLVQQGHDALVFEVPEAQADWAKGVIEAHMTRKLSEAIRWAGGSGLGGAAADVQFTAEGKVHRRWNHV